MYLSSHIAGLVAVAKYLLGLSSPPSNSNWRKLDPGDPSKDEVLLSPVEDPRTPTNWSNMLELLIFIAIVAAALYFGGVGTLAIVLMILGGIFLFQYMIAMLGPFIRKWFSWNKHLGIWGLNLPEPLHRWHGYGQILGRGWSYAK